MGRDREFSATDLTRSMGGAVMLACLVVWIGTGFVRVGERARRADDRSRLELNGTGLGANTARSSAKAPVSIQEWSKRMDSLSQVLPSMAREPEPLVNIVPMPTVPIIEGNPSPGVGAAEIEEFISAGRSIASDSALDDAEKLRRQVEVSRNFAERLGPFQLVVDGYVATITGPGYSKTFELSVFHQGRTVRGRGFIPSPPD